MSNFSLEFEWENPQGAKGAELRATWARLKIAAAGFDPVTLVHDERSKSIRSSVYVSLYPLAEWIATHWWALFHEVEAPRTERASTYYRRHDISSAQEGFALPGLFVYPMGKHALLRWARKERSDAHVVFLGEGCLRVSIDELRSVVSDFVSSVVARLDEKGVVGTLLQEEWESISSIDSEEREFCEAAGALGLDPFALDDHMRSQVIDVCSKVPLVILEDFLDAVDSSRVTEVAGTVVELLESLRGSATHLPTLIGLRRLANIPALPDVAWNRGYSFAQMLRSELGLNGRLLRDMPSIAVALDVAPEALEEAMLKSSKLPSFFDAIVSTSTGGSPAFVIAKRRESSRKFALCRALYEYLSSPEATSMALLSIAHSDRQQANRAFAAEFLAPAHLIGERIEGGAVDEEQLDDLGDEFGVSPMVIRHQIENHRLATVGVSLYP